jgi:hypothetical protein
MANRDRNVTRGRKRHNAARRGAHEARTRLRLPRDRTLARSHPRKGMKRVARSMRSTRKRIAVQHDSVFLLVDELRNINRGERARHHPFGLHAGELRSRFFQNA